MPERLVIIGGDAGGMSAASEARRRRSADDLEIVVFERSSYVSYSACGEPYFVGDYVTDLDSLIARTPEEFAARDIEVHRRHEVTSIDTDARRVVVRPVDGGEDRSEPYDQLLIATGAQPNRPSIEGADLPGVFEMHTLDDAVALRQIIEEWQPRNAVVVGGGYIGVEMAEAFHRHEIAVTIVTASESLLDPQLDPAMGRLIREAAEAIGITVVTDQRIERIEGGDRVTGVCRAAGDPFPADVVLLGLGSHAEVWLATQNGIPVGDTGGIIVDDHQRTRVPGVWAAGDCVETRHRLSAKPVNFHLGTIANKQGRIAGVNLWGGDEAFPGVLGTAITKLCDLEVARTGLTETECGALGLDVVADTFEATTAAGYWPGAQPMTMKVVAERGTRRMLGAQIVGGDGAAKRIDALAMALWNEMTVDALINVDLSYAPPFSGVWDPVLVGARKLRAILGDP
ncbi:MAG: FAD-dependent oxidoreductase [Chloroflexi bacterium]|nr:FAD-dependent oxidoreductase [Chloroflexota bacterium]MDA1147842.1 FAD-dependent oxidoreductase [Chloroflexota bacterium]